jgi:hypothetical protein
VEVSSTSEGVVSATYSFTLDIDTSAAGFLTTPCYSVRFAGERVRVENNETQFFILAYAPSILAPSPDGFRANLQVSVTVLDPELAQDPPPSKLVQGWRAVWMGVE